MWLTQMQDVTHTHTPGQTDKQLITGSQDKRHNATTLLRNISNYDGSPEELWKCQSKDIGHNKPPNKD